MVMRLTLLFTAWNKEYLVNCLFCKFQGLREEKMNTFIANEQYNHLYTRAEILKSFCKVRPLNKLKGFRCYQIVVTLISLLESFRRSFISVVLLLWNRKFWRGIFEKFLFEICSSSHWELRPSFFSNLA